MLPPGFTGACQLEENIKLCFPSRFEGTTLDRYFLQTIRFSSSLCCPVLYLFSFSGSLFQAFFPQLAKVDHSSLFPSKTTRPPSSTPTLPLCFCFHCPSSVSLLPQSGHQSAFHCSSFTFNHLLLFTTFVLLDSCSDSAVKCSRRQELSKILLSGHF